MKQVITFFSEVRNELAKVVWPKREEVLKLTSVVIIISVIFAVYTGGLDYIFTKALEIIVSK